MDMSLSKLKETVKDRDAWTALAMGLHSQTRLRDWTTGHWCWLIRPPCGCSCDQHVDTKRKTSSSRHAWPEALTVRLFRSCCPNEDQTHLKLQGVEPGWDLSAERGPAEVWAPTQAEEWSVPEFHVYMDKGCTFQLRLLNMVLHSLGTETVILCILLLICYWRERFRYSKMNDRNQL